MADDEVVNPLGSPTTNYGWTKPTVGADVDAWGGMLNADLDGIDSVVHGIDVRPAYVLPTASTTVLGGVKVDGSTITIAGGVISGTPSSGPPVTISDTAPASPQVGALWFDSAGGQLYTWFNDGNSSQWTIVVNPGVGQGAYLPLNGGTLTGPLNGTTANFSGVVNSAGGTLTGNLTLSGTNLILTGAGPSGLVIGHSGALGAISGVNGFSYDPVNGAIIENNPNAALNLNRTSNGILAQFFEAQTACGSISVTNATATQFNTSSDVRLKTDAQSFDAGSILDATIVYNFEWTSAPGVRAYGVMAQEANEVFPDAVHHDEANDAWGVDYSKYVPLLINEIKALRVRVAELEAAR